MPIEIRELIIKATIVDPTGEAPPAGVSVEAREDLVEECVEQVMNLLREREER